MATIREKIKNFFDWFGTKTESARDREYREEREKYLKERAEEIAFFNSFNTELCYNYHPVGDVTILGYTDEEVDSDFPMYHYDKAVELAQAYHEDHPDVEMIIFAPIRYAVMIKRKNEGSQ